VGEKLRRAGKIERVWSRRGAEQTSLRAHSVTNQHSHMQMSL
jgi:hypothetical protein